MLITVNPMLITVLNCSHIYDVFYSKNAAKIVDITLLCYALKIHKKKNGDTKFDGKSWIKRIRKARKLKNAKMLKMLKMRTKSTVKSEAKIRGKPKVKN